jgi:hypothetical protein
LWYDIVLIYFSFLSHPSQHHALISSSFTHLALDAAMSISGGLDLRQQLNFKRSMRLWQPILTFSWREDILIGKNARYYRDRLTKDRFLGMLRATSLSVSDPSIVYQWQQSLTLSLSVSN